MSVETTAPSTVTRPMTGEEYLESIRDRREIYCYGERVDAPGSGRRHDDGGRRAVVGPWKTASTLIPSGSSTSAA